MGLSTIFSKVRGAEVVAFNLLFSKVSEYRVFKVFDCICETNRVMNVFRLCSESVE